MKGHPIPFLLRLTLVMSLFLLMATASQAQSDVVRASVRSVTGIARKYAGPHSGAFILKRNDPLEPENRIETAQNSRVVISLTDGGQITVLPNSTVVLKKFLVPHTARELLDIIVGRVVVKIHHIGGKPNPYRLNSPAASIAVRGTEFIVDVQSGGETLVVVREGLVEVWSHSHPDNKRLVTPGRRVIVRPGGGISSAFPGPRRSFDSVSQNSGEASPTFFSAFPDRHLDSLENPAYAADFKNDEGRLLLLPSVSEPYSSRVEGASSSEEQPRFDYSIFPQLTFFTPIPGSRLVIGGGISALDAAWQDLVDIRFPNYEYYDSQKSRLNASNVSLIAAYSFGDHDRTSVGIGVDRLSGDNSFSSHHNNNSNYKTDKFKRVNSDDLNARFARTRLTLGLARRFSESMKIGLYYRQGFNSSDQGNDYQQEYQEEHEDGSRRDISYFASGRTINSTSSSSSELGIRFRASLTRRFFYGVEGSYLYERVNSRRETSNQPIAYNSYLARRARLGGGLGFALTSKIILNFDAAGGLFNSSRPADELIISGGSFLALSSSPTAQSLLLNSPRSVRGTFVSGHAAVQTNLWRDLLLSFSSLTTIRRDFVEQNYNGNVFGYKDKVMRQLYNAGLGWKFQPNFTAEYLLSVDPYDRVPSHSLRLRYTFNLGVFDKK